MEMTDLMMPSSMTSSARLKSTMTSSSSDEMSSEGPAEHAAPPIQPLITRINDVRPQICDGLVQIGRGRCRVRVRVRGRGRAGQGWGLTVAPDVQPEEDLEPQCRSLCVCPRITPESRVSIHLERGLLHDGLAGLIQCQCQRELNLAAGCWLHCLLLRLSTRSFIQLQHAGS